MIPSICEMEDSFVVHLSFRTMVHFIGPQGWNNTLIKDRKWMSAYGEGCIKDRSH